VHLHALFSIPLDGVWQNTTIQPNSKKAIIFNSYIKTTAKWLSNSEGYQGPAMALPRVQNSHWKSLNPNLLACARQHHRFAVCYQ